MTGYAAVAFGVLQADLGQGWKVIAVGLVVALLGHYNNAVRP